jgi:ligand-binding sensor domain-containing protein
MGGGLFRIRGTSGEHYGRAEGLSGDDVQALYEDREGILWVTTTNGIDSFRDATVTTFSKLEGLGNDEAIGVLASRDGAIWLRTGARWITSTGTGCLLDSLGEGPPGDLVSAMLED